MDFTIKIWIAYILDLIFGDPYWFPHPVRIIGKYIQILERIFYKFKLKKFFGGILALIVIFTTFIVSYFLSKYSNYMEIFFLYTTLATKSLGNEGIKVYRILKKGDLNLAKKELSYLVSRDTEEMNEEQVVRSVLETIAENSVDGIIAPLFYAFLGSFFIIKGVNLTLPFAMGYKAVNTLDSMLGYKNEKYINFGFFSAKIDDCFNFVPARIAGAILIPISSLLLGYGLKKSLKIFLRDRKNHSSPNSGHPEASFAGALGVQFGGKTKYFGKYFQKPTIGNKENNFEKEIIKKGYRLMFMSSLISMVIFTSIYYII